MAPAQEKIVLTWSTIITILGMCTPILIFQAKNHKEDVQNYTAFQDSVLVDRRDFINHVTNEAAKNKEQDRRLDKLEETKKHYYAATK